MFVDGEERLLIPWKIPSLQERIEGFDLVSLFHLGILSWLIEHGL